MYVDVHVNSTVPSQKNLYWTKLKISILNKGHSLNEDGCLEPKCPYYIRGDCKLSITCVEIHVEVATYVDTN